MSSNQPISPCEPIYRPNVAGVLINPKKQVFVAQRADFPESWQFPQGGVDKNETHEQAFIREMQEEIGLNTTDYNISKTYGPYRYDFPPHIIEKFQAKAKKGKASSLGQEQTYYICNVLENATFNLEAGLAMGEKIEFINYRWINPAEFQLSWLPEFKQATYQQVFLDIFDIQLTI